MFFLLSVACIETGLSPDKPEPAFSDTGAPDTDTGAPDTDTGAPDTDTGAPDTDTGAPPDTGAPDTDTGEPVDTAVDTGSSSSDDTGAPPGPVAVSGMCDAGYPWTGWTDAAATSPELHVVGVYESAYGSGGRVEVAVPRTGDMVLALTSYSGVDWQVDLPAGTGVTEIVVSTYEPAVVTFVGAGTAPVTYAGWIGSCGYEIPDRDPYSGCETPDLRADVEAYVGLAMSSFQGCYSGGTFSVDP